MTIPVSVYTCGMPTIRVPAPLKFYLDNQSEIVLKGETVQQVVAAQVVVFMQNPIAA